MLLRPRVQVAIGVVVLLSLFTIYQSRAESARWGLRTKPPGNDAGEVPDSTTKAPSEDELVPVHVKASTTTTATGPSPSCADAVDWHKFAYIQYVTSSEVLCNSVMIFESLHGLGSKADRVLMYPEEWGQPGDRRWKLSKAVDRDLLLKARDKYRVILKPVQIIHQHGDDTTWESGFTKLLAWNQTSYARAIMLDSDATVLKHLDHLFYLPSVPLAIPRAYWLMPNPPPKDSTKSPLILDAQLLVVAPSQRIFSRLLEAVRAKGLKDYDMEIINRVLGGEALVLPHRGLALLSGEFRYDRWKKRGPGSGPVYDRYLGLGGGDKYLDQYGDEVWDAKRVLAEAHYVHFSDWPRPKPWYEPHQQTLSELLPVCHNLTTANKALHDSDVAQGSPPGDEHEPQQQEDCRDREIWLWLYSDFKKRRKDVCGLDLFPPPSRVEF